MQENPIPVLPSGLTRGETAHTLLFTSMMVMLFISSEDSLVSDKVRLVEFAKRLYRGSIGIGSSGRGLGRSGGGKRWR